VLHGGEGYVGQQQWCSCPRPICLKSCLPAQGRPLPSVRQVPPHAHRREAGRVCNETVPLSPGGMVWAQRWGMSYPTTGGWVVHRLPWEGVQWVHGLGVGQCQVVKPALQNCPLQRCRAAHSGQLRSRGSVAKPARRGCLGPAAAGWGSSRGWV